MVGAIRGTYSDLPAREIDSDPSKTSHGLYGTSIAAFGLWWLERGKGKKKKVGLVPPRPAVAELTLQLSAGDFRSMRQLTCTFRSSIVLEDPSGYKYNRPRA